MANAVDVVVGSVWQLAIPIVLNGIPVPAGIRVRVLRTSTYDCIVRLEDVPNTPAFTIRYENLC